MKICYNQKLKCWECEKRLEKGEKLAICITDWRNTKKGPLIDFAIFIAGKEPFFFELEVFTRKSMTAKQIPEFCSAIIDAYECWGDKFLSSAVFLVFPECNVDAYYRKAGYDREVLQYIGKRKSFFGKSKIVSYEANKEEKNKYPLPALEYPGSRLDCILD